MEEKCIIGIDEAGRGPLAGPVAVGVVCIALKDERAVHEDYFSKGIRDSKKMSEKKREALYDQIRADSRIRYVVAMVSAKDIDTRGIAPSIRHALAGAIKKCSQGVSLATLRVVLDGALKAPKEYTQETIIQGDEKELTIALASVCAKVERDRRMRALAVKYPQYGFEKHKGYGTKGHMEAIRAYGVCEEHRKTFVHI